jgi:hypothetical protein
LPHPSHTPKTLILLAAMAALLALAVGLVSSARRASPRARPAPATSAASFAEHERDGLRTPEILPPAEAELAPAPQAPEAPPAARSERARLVGLVLRPDGEPAGRAQVVLGTLRAECEADGSFELQLPGDLGGADLVAWEPGLEPTVRPAFGASLAGGLVAGGASHVRLVLGGETLTLEGTVQHEDGTPAVGWTVELDGLDPLAAFGLRAPVRSDESGRFVLAELPAGSHVLRVWKDSPRAAFRSSPAAAGATGLTIRVVPD